MYKNKNMIVLIKIILKYFWGIKNLDRRWGRNVKVFH